MRTFLLIIFGLILFIIILFFILGRMSRAGEAAGLQNGRLYRCPDKPNCVCSEQSVDSRNFIEPLIIPENNSEALETLQEVILQLDGKIQTRSESYLAATFTSGLFGFVDDVEVMFDPEQNVVHIRSASRVGHADFDINRKRVKQIRRLFDEKSRQKIPENK